MHLRTLFVLSAALGGAPFIQASEAESLRSGHVDLLVLHEPDEGLHLAFAIEAGGPRARGH